MPYIKQYEVNGKCKCTKCGETFNISDDNISYCPNNCCAVTINRWGSRCKTTNGMSDCYEIIERNITHNPKYYVKLNKNVFNLLYKIRAEKDYDLFVFLDEDVDSDGTTYVNYIELKFSTPYNSRNEENEFICTIGCTFSNNESNSNEIIWEKLNRFLKLYKDYKNGDVNLEVSNRTDLENTYDWDREQIKAYNYTFYVH